MEVLALQIREDNWSYIFAVGTAAVAVDAADPPATLAALRCDWRLFRAAPGGVHIASAADVQQAARVKNGGVERTLVLALTTHHHLDHSGGNARLAELCPGVSIVSPPPAGAEDVVRAERSDAVEMPAVEAATAQIARVAHLLPGVTITPIATPCHTLTSLCYFVATQEEPASSAQTWLLTGDFLFRLGCGCFFEGTARDFLRGVAALRAVCAPKTRLLYGHDYNEKNERFSRQFIALPATTAPFLTWEEELAHNPFLNSGATGLCGSAEEVVHELRTRKNNFK